MWATVLVIQSNDDFPLVVPSKQESKDLERVRVYNRKKIQLPFERFFKVSLYFDH